MWKERLKREYLPFALGTLIWALTVIWVNFHGVQWFNFDMYADAEVAKRMAEQHTLFPENWIFGNQYYVIATPAVAALFYHIVPDSVCAMACASTLMYALILMSFVWCFMPIVSTQALWAGLFCMAGATLLGDSISSSTYGFQVLYTMASYYACYLLVILLHVGIWMRILKGIRVSMLAVIPTLAAVFALGVQSLRETLSLCLPLLLVTGADWLCHRAEPGRKKGFLFASCSLLFNLAGVAVHEYVRQHMGSNFASNVSVLIEGAEKGTILGRAADSLRAFLDIAGLRYLHYGVKWMPLVGMGLVLLLLAVAVTGLYYRSRKQTDAWLLLVFCWTSLAGVFLAGVLVIQVRAIYYFVWFLLVPFSVSLLMKKIRSRGRTLFCAAVFLFGAVNYFYNVYPDAVKYREQKQFYAEIVSWLEERGIGVIYGDYQAPTISACSGDRIEYASVFPNAGAEPDSHSDLLIPNGSPVATERYHHIEPERSVLVLSESPYDDYSGYRYLNEYMTEEYRSEFKECFKQEASFESSQITYYIYSFSDKEVIG